VFDGPKEEKSSRKKLGQKDKGTTVLFGTHIVDYGNKSNIIPILQQKKEQSKYSQKKKPERTAEQRKHEELHGKTLAKYEASRKSGDTLVAATQMHTILKLKSGKGGVGREAAMKDSAKDLKHQNLQSSILANQEYSTQQQQP
jgi:hypothetical protein